MKAFNEAGWGLNQHQIRPSEIVHLAKPIAASARSQLAGAIVQPTALVLGAGFSKWAAGLPVAQRLFDFRLSPLNTRELRRLQFLRHAKAEWNRQHPDGQAESFIGDMLRSSPRYRQTVLWYLTRRLSDPFVASISRGSQVLMIDDRRAQRLGGIRRVAKFFQLAALNPLAGIVTPNYDLLVEYALGTRGFNYGHIGEVLTGRGRNPLFPWQGANPVLTGHLALAKVHGSISWDQHSRYTDGRCGMRGDALVVPPYPDKPRPPELEDVWELAESILNSAKTAIIFGFGFNPYDKMLLKLLEQAGRNLKSVLLVDTDPKIGPSQSLWPAAEIVGCPPPPAGNTTLKDWLRYVRSDDRLNQ